MYFISFQKTYVTVNALFHVIRYVVVGAQKLPPNHFSPAVRPIYYLLLGVVRHRQYVAEEVVATDNHVGAPVVGAQTSQHHPRAVGHQYELVRLFSLSIYIFNTNIYYCF